MLPKEAIEEYKKLYEKRFGITLSDEEAIFRASNLVSLYVVVYGIKPPMARTHNDQGRPS